MLNTAQNAELRTKIYSRRFGFFAISAVERLRSESDRMPVLRCADSEIGAPQIKK